MSDQGCADYDRLQSEVQTILQKVVELSSAQVETFRAKDKASFMTLDKELELTVGRKERTIGAFTQHCKDHKCQSWI
jgi:hypothetical protein